MSTFQSSAQASGKGAATVPFPLKLRDMLEDAYEKDMEDVVSWEMDGSAFKVHDPQAFVDRIMPHYFNQTKYKSFQRQLNLYGFSRVTRGPNKGCYLHEYFHRNNIERCREITRKKAASDEFVSEPVINLAPTWLPASMVVEPDPIPDHKYTQTSQLPSNFASTHSATKKSSSPFDAFESFFQANVAKSTSLPGDKSSCFQKTANQNCGSSESNPGNALQRMLDNMLDPTGNVTSKEDQSGVQAEEPKKYQRTAVFPDKLHDMLEYCEKNNLEHISSWQMDGRAFRVHNIDLFMSLVMPHFFKQSKYESLQRQLNLYGFTRVPKGPLKGCYHHPLFLKGGRALSRGMLRRKPEDTTVAAPSKSNSTSSSSRSVSSSGSDSTSSSSNNKNKTCNDHVKKAPGIKSTIVEPSSPPNVIGLSADNQDNQLDDDFFQGFDVGTQKVNPLPSMQSIVEPNHLTFPTSIQQFSQHQLKLQQYQGQNQSQKMRFGMSTSMLQPSMNVIPRNDSLLSSSMNNNSSVSVESHLQNCNNQDLFPFGYAPPYRFESI